MLNLSIGKDFRSPLLCVLRFISNWIRDNNFENVNEAIENLKKDDLMKDNRVFIQSIDAYSREDYDLAALGFTAMIDRVLSDYSEMITSTSISRRVDEIRKKVEDNGESSLDEAEYNNYILIITWINAMKKFGSYSKFDEQEPDLNRHWIAHGRKSNKVNQIDCIRIINLLYGTILMGELAKKQ